MDKKVKLKLELAKKLKKETSVTGTGASVTPGTGAGVATKYAFGKRDNKGTPSDWKAAPSIPNRKSKAMDYKELWEGKTHIGTDIKTDSDVYFDTETGTFHINIIDAAGNRWNKLQVNTIDDVLAKFPNWKWTEQGKATFGDTLDEASAYDSLAGVLKQLGAEEDSIKVLIKAVEMGALKPTDAITIVKKALGKKEIKEAKLDIDDRVKVTYGNEFYGETGTITDISRGFVTVEMDKDGNEYSMHSSDVQKIEDEDDDYDDEDMLQERFKSGKEFLNIKMQRYPKSLSKVNNLINMIGESNFTMDMAEWIWEFFNNASFERPVYEESLQEGYAQFRNETKMRSKPDQFHQAVKQVKKKMNEINRIFEYVDRLKNELSEGEDLKYKKYTENAFQQIKESAKALFLKSTKLK